MRPNLVRRLRSVATGVIALSFLVAIASARVEAQVFAYPPTSVVGNCAALPQTNFFDVGPGNEGAAQGISAQVVPAATGLPSYCDVIGYTDDSIKWELQLPVGGSWNGNLFFDGCGGYCGGLVGDAIGLGGGLRGIAEGYASVSTDMGHPGTAADGLWGWHDLKARINYAYLAVHKVTMSAKAVTTAYYGSAPRRSYFVGESSGGGQAVIEAERFPNDFDGIVAQQPTLNTAGFAVLAWNWADDWFFNGQDPVFSITDVQNIHSAVEAACDALDGTTDGIIDDPEKCHFDVGKLQCGTSTNSSWCLSARQVVSLRNIYQGAHTSTGTAIFPGQEYGSELAWIGVYVPATPGSIPFSPIISSNSLRFLILDPSPGPDYNPRSFNYDTDLAKIAKWYPIYDGANPDLRGFKAHGGKLLITAGWADELVLPKTTVNFYNAIVALFGGTANTSSFVRLFMTPGMYHGAPTTIEPNPPQFYDPLAVISNWVDRGVAPDSLVVLQYNAQGQLGSSRTLFPFPREPAGFKGS